MIITCEGLQVLVGASCYLSQSIMQLIGNMAPLLFEEFGSLALENVLKHYQAVDGLPVLVTKNRSGEISPESFVVLSQVPFLYFIAGNHSPEHLCSKKPILSNIIRVG